MTLSFFCSKIFTFCLLDDVIRKRSVMVFRLSDLRKGLSNLIQSTREGEKSSADLHRANLYSLINCVDTLAALHDKMQLEKNTRGWPLTRNIADKVCFLKFTLCDNSILSD